MCVAGIAYLWGPIYFTTFLGTFRRSPQVTEYSEEHNVSVRLCEQTQSTQVIVGHRKDGEIYTSNCQTAA